MNEFLEINESQYSIIDDMSEKLFEKFHRNSKFPNKKALNKENTCFN